VLRLGLWVAGVGQDDAGPCLAKELQLPCLSKDEVKEALMDALGAPTTVAESRRIGTAAPLQDGRNGAEMWCGPGIFTHDLVEIGTLTA
jgi:hypothetical protein